MALLAISLGGCVAAAIPLAASGALVGRDSNPDGQDTALEPGQPSLGAPAQEEGGRLAARGDTPPPRMLRPDEAIPDNARGTAQPARGNPYAAFYSHAIAQARRDPVETPRKSAMLASPASLEPVTQDCSIKPPAVLIDLDPQGGVFAADTGPGRNPQLAEILSALRVQEVEVHWISGASASDAGAIRKRLLETGLDPWGRDPLLLLRRPGDRKQVLRRELSGTHCVVAIAADTRGDFDELFDYLRHPAAGAPLDILIGDGWFLTPLPLTHEEG